MRVQGTRGPWTCSICGHGDHKNTRHILAYGEDEQHGVVICDECLALGEAEMKDRLRSQAAAARRSLKRRMLNAVADLLTEVEWKEALPDRLSALPTLEAVRRARAYEHWIKFMREERKYPPRRKTPYSTPTRQPSQP